VNTVMILPVSQILENSLVAERLVDTQERLSSVELVVNQSLKCFLKLLI
jgi:hypothetical protein